VPSPLAAQLHGLHGHFAHDILSDVFAAFGE
jgi:hypothetical protein